MALTSSQLPCKTKDLSLFISRESVQIPRSFIWIIVNASERGTNILFTTKSAITMFDYYLLRTSSTILATSTKRDLPFTRISAIIIHIQSPLERQYHFGILYCKVIFVYFVRINLDSESHHKFFVHKYSNFWFFISFAIDFLTS